MLSLVGIDGRVLLFSCNGVGIPQAERAEMEKIAFSLLSLRTEMPIHDIDSECEGCSFDSDGPGSGYSLTAGVEFDRKDWPSHWFSAGLCLGLARSVGVMACKLPHGSSRRPCTRALSCFVRQTHSLLHREIKKIEFSKISAHVS